MRLIVAVLLGLSIFTSQAQTLQIGVLADDPPFSFQVGKGHQFSGFEVNLMSELCARLKVTCTFSPYEFNDLFQKIAMQQIDLAIARISITLDRTEKYLFSLPYLTADGQLMVKSNSSIQRVEDLAGKRVGLFKSSLYKDYLLQTFSGSVSVVEYNSIPVAFQALIDNEVDAVLLTKLGEQYLIANSQSNPSSFRYIGKPIPLGVGYGILANVQSTALIDRVNKALHDIETDGTYLRIYNTYFGLLSN